MADKFHKKPFDDATKLKLEIFGECFREWLPVFIYNPTVSKIFVYDFFALLLLVLNDSDGCCSLLPDQAVRQKYNYAYA